MSSTKQLTSVGTVW